MSQLCPADLSIDAFPYGTFQRTEVAGIPVRMFRISYVGDSGWEIYTDTHHGLQLWDALADAGAGFDIRPVGIGVYGTTGRLEKGYRLMGAELESEYTPVEAGLARPKVKSADFIGKQAYLRAREEGPAAILCTLSMQDHTGVDDIDRFPVGGNEPILTLDGERLVDRKGRVSRVTSAGSGPSVGSYLLMAYLPPEHARAGTGLTVMYMNELFPVRVEVAGATPLFDPDNKRMKS
jgi:glycine cleavage system aminomethyltransferase T